MDIEKLDEKLERIATAIEHLHITLMGIANKMPDNTVNATIMQEFQKKFMEKLLK